MHDVTSLVIFLLFMAVFFITQPSRLPLYMTADIIHVVKALYKRILSLKKYRSLTRNLETRFPDATPEELEAADTCIICRDFLFDGSKKLPCSHIFHIDCLRSWLVQQQSCPTCRADIPTDDNAASAAAPSTSADGSGSPAGSSRAPTVQQQQQRSSGSASRGQQQQQQRAGVGASASPGSGGAAGSAPNARPAAAGREEKRIQSSEGHDRISAVAAVADATPASVEAVAGQRTRMPAVGVAGNLQNSARYVNNAHVNGVSDPLALLDMRVRRSSGRLEAAAAAALAAAASAAAVAPSARTSAPTSRSRVDYADELEAALRLRATQAEAVITGALAQTLAMTYQMCDLYRLHASLWTIEAQRAQLEACHQLLQRSELRRSSAVVTYADAAPAEGIRRDPTTRFGAAGTADPAADALPRPDVPAPPAAALAPSVVVSRTPITVAETQRQGDLATAKGASGIDATLKRNEKKPYVSCPSVVVEGASRNTPVQTTSSSDLAVGNEGLGENNVLLGQAATPAAVGAPTRVLTAPEGAEAAATEGEAAGAVRRAEVGRAAGTEMRQKSGREYVVVCPSHLVHQAIIPYFSPYNEIFVVPFAHGGDGRLVDDGVRVKSSADGNCTVISDTHRSNAGICISNANGSLAPPAAPSASSVVPPGISETYDDVAAAGQYFLCGPGNATSAAWQSLRGLPCSALPPLPPFAGFPSVSGLLPGLGEAPAAQQRIQLATNSHLAAAVEQGMTRVSESSGDVKLPPFAENPAALRIPSYNVAAHVANGTGSSAGGEEQVHNHFGNSSHTAVAADGLVRPASTDLEENAERSSSTTAETLKGVTSAMAAELERLRREQHRRWKRGGTASNNSSDV